jgi:hypothetical protein
MIKIIVRKFLTYFFIAAYLFSFTETRQVLKVPNLIEHYFFYKQHYANPTVFEFIKIHYLDKQEKDEDYDQDMQLPFKTHNFSIASVNLIFPPKEVKFDFEHSVLPINEQHNFVYAESFYPSVFLKIWQPPKI